MLTRSRSHLGSCLLAWAFATVVPSLARAEQDLLSGLNIAAPVIAATVGAGGVVALVGNSVNLARRTPNRGWPIAGHVIGPLNILVGALAFGLYRYQADAAWAVGGTMIGLGAVDSALSIAGHIRHVQASTPVSRAASGVGLRLSF